LLTAHFSEQKNIFDKTVLKQALADVGLNADEGIAKLDDDDARFEVKQKKQYWQNMGVNSVPTIVFNRKEGVTGAQPVDVFKQVLTDFTKDL